MGDVPSVQDWVECFSAFRWLDNEERPTSFDFQQGNKKIKDVFCTDNTVIMVKLLLFYFG
mgnify:CR=1 FL=1